MTNEHYDDLLVEARMAREMAKKYRTTADGWDKRLDEVLRLLGEEEHRIAQQALTSMHSASFLLAVGE